MNFGEITPLTSEPQTTVIGSCQELVRQTEIPSKRTEFLYLYFNMSHKKSL
jgi:hypothetical protein